MVDGDNIKYCLWKVWCDWSHGGQFGEFRDSVKRFYQGLLRGGIIPIVVLDGIDYTGQKWSTTVERREQRFEFLHKKMHTSEVVKEKVVPALGEVVYLQVLAELEVRYIVVDGEADDVVAEIANYYECPVLSSDSDFYMYDLKGGYVPMNDRNNYKLADNMKSQTIEADVYYFQNLCAQLEFEDESVRLIIPALAGNDFWSGFDTLISAAGAPSTYDHPLFPCIHFASLYASLENFVNDIPHVNGLSDAEKARLKRNCEKSRALYAFRSGEISKMTTELRTFEQEHLPPWVLSEYRKGKFSKLPICALVSNEFVFEMFVEDTTRESCVLSSQSIRKHIYRILRCDCVIEHFRVEQGLCSERTHPFQSASGSLLPPLRLMPNLPTSEREGLLYNILGCNRDDFSSLQGHWKLALAATLFWYRETQPPPHIIKSLLVSFLVCSGHSKQLSKPHELTASFNFTNHSKWMRNLHWFAQWQSCYKDAVSLAEVLMFPIPVTCPSQLYNGKLAMGCAMFEGSSNAFIQRLGIDKGLFFKLLGVISPELACEQRNPSQDHEYGLWMSCLQNAFKEPKRYQKSRTYNIHHGVSQHDGLCCFKGRFYRHRTWNCSSEGWKSQTTMNHWKLSGGVLSMCYVRWRSSYSCRFINSRAPCPKKGKPVTKRQKPAPRQNVKGAHTYAVSKKVVAKKAQKVKKKAASRQQREGVVQSKIPYSIALSEGVPPVQKPVSVNVEIDPAPMATMWNPVAKRPEPVGDVINKPAGEMLKSTQSEAVVQQKVKGSSKRSSPHKVKGSSKCSSQHKVKGLSKRSSPHKVKGSSKRLLLDKV